ncbi:hypothetical protein ACLSZP_06800 [Avibacterium avium]|uniref:hypothetical protein n=1 Tax=Avibacterium avium TaxID=751 RepID=UPI003BF90FE2
MFHGDITYFLNALGENQGSKKILDAIKIISTDFEINNFECESIQNVYLQFFKGGVDFVFNVINNNETLESIFFFIDGDDEHIPYRFVSSLIIGLPISLERNDIINSFGIPEKNGKMWIRYIQNNKYIHFEFNENNTLKLISLFILN